jgi:hypothetical protein
MKKIHSPLARATIYIFCLFLGVNFLIEWEITFRQERDPDPSTKKLLYYLYGIRNLTMEEKMALIKEAEHFPEEWKDRLDEKIASAVLPDKNNNYSVDTNFVISFHQASGNPVVTFGCYQGDCGHNRYLYFKNTIVLTVFSVNGINPNDFSLTGYFDELAHAKQWSRSPKITTVKYWAEWLWQNIVDQDYQSQIEKEAHMAIGPALKEEYLNYRRMYLVNLLTGPEKRDSVILLAHAPLLEINEKHFNKKPWKKKQNGWTRQHLEKR